MKKTLLILGIFAVAAATNAFATCGTPTTFGQSLDTCPGGFCYVISPVNPAGPPAGSFWSWGSGNVATGTGDDNGTAPSSAWCPAFGPGCYMVGDWGGDTRIDGCIKTVAPKTVEIMVASFADAGPDQGYFAVAAVQNGAPGAQYDFARLNVHIDLVPIPKAVVTGTVRAAPNVTITVAGPVLAGGVYTDNAATAAELVTGWKLYKQVLSRGALAPASRSKSGWVLVQSAAAGAPITYTETDCATDKDIYLAYGLTYNSGFESTFVGQNSREVQCGPTLAEPGNFKIIDKKPPKRTR